MSIRYTLVLRAILLLVSCSGSGADQADRMIDVGTHMLHARITGEGVPAVVIDAGIGGGASDWRQIQDQLSVHTNVVTYDRAGYGESEQGPLPRDSGREADELRTLLQRAEVPGPYVLVGHSLGGLNIQVYASRYPNDVAGVVLLDPPPLAWLLGESHTDLLAMAAHMTDEWQTIADQGIESDDVEERAQAEFFGTIASEHREMLGKSGQLASAIETFGDVPVVIIASGVPNPVFGDVAHEYQHFWIAQSRALAAKSPQGLFVLAEESSHQLHADATDLVVEKILFVLDEVRGLY